MNNILIKLGPYGTMLTVAPQHTPLLLELVPHLRAVESSGYGEAQAFTVTELPPEVAFVASDKLTPLNPREAALKKALDKKESDWVTAFTERDKQKARADELDREVARLRAGIASPATDE